MWIAYYENQKSDASVHSPMTCLTGGGWKTVHSEVFELAPGKPINYLILEQAGNRMAVYYWYFERGRWLASDYGHKLEHRLGPADEQTGGWGFGALDDTGGWGCGTGAGKVGWVFKAVESGFAGIYQGEMRIL